MKSSLFSRERLVKEKHTTIRGALVFVVDKQMPFSLLSALAYNLIR
jgi:hypothetical protein